MPNINYSLPRKAECVENLIELRSVTGVRRWYAEKYGLPVPIEKSLRSWLQSFRDRGTLVDRPRSGRPSRTDTDVSRIESLLLNNPEVSIRTAERELNIPRSTIQRVPRRILRMFPYKISFLQQLLPNDYQSRLEFAQHFRHEMRNDPGYISRIVYSDECLFHNNGVVNKHNARVWGTANPQMVIEVPLRSEKVMVWCAMHKSRIIGPYFFSEPSVTGSNYKRMLRYYGLPKIQELPGSPIFQ